MIMTITCLATIGYYKTTTTKDISIAELLVLLLLL